MHLLGWPAISFTKGVDEKALRDLAGGGIYLGCLGIIMNAVYLDPSAPWWAPSGVQERIARQVIPLQDDGTPKRRRRIGPVKSMT